MYSQTSARPLRGSASSPGVPAIRGSPLAIERFHAGREAEAVPPRGHARPTLRAVLYGLAGVLFLCEAARAYFQGLPAGGSLPWAAWLVPLATWSVYALLLYAAFFFLVALLRRPWIEHERLAFPLVQVPLEIVGHDRVPTGSREFFRN